MLGIVFSEFIEMVEEDYSEETADELVDMAQSKFKSAGIYTAVGTYDHDEIIALAGWLGELTNTPVADLVHAYGKRLFGRFNIRYPELFENIDGALEFLEGIESRIHAAVRKLYPQAQLPEFECQWQGKNILVMHYRSKRPFAMLAHGLIEGCIEHFGETITIERQDLSGDRQVEARFTLTRH